MIQWDLLSRAVPNSKIYSDIRDLRLKYKHEGNPLQAPLKIVLNGSYGVSLAINRETNKPMGDMADPKHGRAVCVNGQLMLLQLIEELSNNDYELVQTNTDAVVYKVPKKELDNFKRMVATWEKRTRLNMEYDYITYMAQKDVNNYIAVFDNGTIERKGGAVKKSSTLDNDLPIVSDAVVEYFVNGVDPKQYIMKEDNMMRFMKTYKLSSKYSHAIYNDKVLTDKVYRVFASRSRKDGIVYKCKEGGKPEKFASCPTHAKIINGNIQDMKVPNWLDKQWYIDMTWDRINSFKGDK
jgi:hypothetical protein